MYVSVFVLCREERVSFAFYRIVIKLERSSSVSKGRAFLKLEMG